jgi:hypothetical protein
MYLVSRGEEILMVDATKEGDGVLLGPSTAWHCWDVALRIYGVDIKK